MISAFLPSLIPSNCQYSGSTCLRSPRFPWFLKHGNHFFFSTYQHDVHYSSISVTTLQSCSSPPKAAHFNFKVNHLSFYVLWLFSLGFRRGPPPCPFTLLIHIYTHPSLFLCYFCTLSHSLTNIYIYISIKHHSPCLIYLFILIFFFSSWTTVIFVSMLMIES